MKKFTTLLMLILGTSAAIAAEPDYPTKPVSIIVAYAPGGQGDVFARLVGEKLSTVYKQPVVVDNKPGVSGTVGTRLAAKAKNDGYTLLLGQTGEITVNRLLMKDLGYDPMKELVPVVLIGNAPLVMLAPADAPYNTVNEFIQMARAKPGEFSYGTVGAGTPGHLSAVALGLGAKLNMVHVPYKGSAPAVVDVASGQVDMMFDGIPSLLPHIKSGKLRPIAAVSVKRNSQLPELPTFTELGYPSMVASVWYGLMAPAGTPQAIIDKVNAAMNKTLAVPELQKKLEDGGAIVMPGTPKDFETFYLKDYARWGDVIKNAGISTKQ